MFHNWVLVGRLKPGFSIAAVQSQVDVVARRLQQQYPATNKVKGLRLDPLQSALMQPQEPRLIALMGAVGLVLLIAQTLRYEFRTAWAYGTSCTYRLDRWTGESWLVAGDSSCPRSKKQSDAEFRALIGR